MSTGNLSSGHRAILLVLAFGALSSACTPTYHYRWKESEIPANEVTPIQLVGEVTVINAQADASKTVDFYWGVWHFFEFTPSVYGNYQQLTEGLRAQLAGELAKIPTLDSAERKTITLRVIDAFAEERFTGWEAFLKVEVALNNGKRLLIPVKKSSGLTGTMLSIFNRAIAEATKEILRHPAVLSYLEE